LFSASDSAFGFACNSHGRISVALDVTINFTLPAKSGDLLTVEAVELHLGNKVGVYEVRTTNEKNELVALFRGTAYRTEKQVGDPMPAGDPNPAN
jgi:acyl-CoA thioesterase